MCGATKNSKPRAATASLTRYITRRQVMGSTYYYYTILFSLGDFVLNSITRVNTPSIIFYNFVLLYIMSYHTRVLYTMLIRAHV